MKKIFTLIAVALMAASANAQTAEVGLYDQGTTYKDGDALSSANASLTLGADLKKWTVSASKVKEDGYLAPFGKTVQIKNSDTEEMEDKFGIVIVVGGNNPKDQTEAGKGSGVNYANDKEVGRLPQNGCYYIFKAVTSGKVQAGIQLNPDKAFYLVDATDAKKSEDEKYLEIALPGANLHSYVIKDEKGDEVKLSDDSDGKGGKVVSDKVTGVLEFDATAEHTYYYFCSGSKLFSFGYIFTPSTETGIQNFKSTDKNGVRFNLAGQQVDENYKGVVIVDGKKMIQK